MLDRSCFWQTGLGVLINAVATYCTYMGRSSREVLQLGVPDLTWKLDQSGVRGLDPYDLQRPFPTKIILRSSVGNGRNQSLADVSLGLARPAFLAAHCNRREEKCHKHLLRR